MRIGDFCRCLNLLLRGILHTKGNIVENGVVEKNRLLVHIAYQPTERMDGQVAYILAINLDSAA